MRTVAGIISAILTQVTSNNKLALFRRHADRPVEADRLAVEHLVLDDLLDQGGEFVGTAEPRGKRDLLTQRLADLFGKLPSMGVSKMPGAIVITRMPNRASSRATGSVSPATPAFDAA